MTNIFNATVKNPEGFNHDEEVDVSPFIKEKNLLSEFNIDDENDKKDSAEKEDEDN